MISTYNDVLGKDVITSDSFPISFEYVYLTTTTTSQWVSSETTTTETTPTITTTTGDTTLPQTGYSKWYHVVVVLAACMTGTGAIMVIGSGVLKRKQK